jgi:hypothetical protein
MIYWPHGGEQQQRERSAAAMKYANALERYNARKARRKERRTAAALQSWAALKANKRGPAGVGQLRRVTFKVF